MVTQRGSDRPKDAHTGLSRLYKANPAEGRWPGEPLRPAQIRPGVSFNLPLAATAPRHRGPLPPPALTMVSWQEMEQTHTDHQKSPREGGMG